jgi:hypothetical protein
MEKDTKYRKYLEGLERIEAKTKLDKATKKVKDMLSAKAAEKSSFVKRRMELAGKNAYEKAIGVFPKVSQAGKDAAAYAAKAAKASKYGKIAAGVAGAGIAASAYLRSKMKDIKEKQQAEGKMGGGMMNKYSKGESVKLSPKQMKIARMAPPTNQITGDDFKAMKANVGKSVKGYGQARKSGMGLEDENISLGKGSDYIKDLL